jgi:riboflavin synthase
VFTGLVEDLGNVFEADIGVDGVRLTIETPLSEELGAGDSVAINGVCLTATWVGNGAFDVEVMHETLARTSLAKLEPGHPVNLELALRAGDRLGGHIVQGHVDGVGNVSDVEDDGFARRMRIEALEEVLRYVVQKGSITVDGVSLTVAAVDNQSFTVSLIPETLQRTNLGTAEPGTTVNLEVDVLAKYVEKMVQNISGART